MELLRRYANRSDLLFDISQTVNRLHGERLGHDDERPDELSSACQHPKQRLLSTSFTYDDVASMVAEYDAGTPARIIAEGCQIGPASLKRIIRERGARRKDRGK